MLVFLSGVGSLMVDYLTSSIPCMLSLRAGVPTIAKAHSGHYYHLVKRSDWANIRQGRWCSTLIWSALFDGSNNGLMMKRLQAGGVPMGLEQPTDTVPME